MQWQNHKLCNSIVIYALTGSLKATILSTIGSILPDVLELGGIIRHRTITHYPYLYLIPAMMLVPFIHHSIYTQITYWIMIGCITHLALDTASKSGIPYITPYGSKKIALNLYTTFHISEWYISIAITLLFGMLARYNGYLYSTHFTKEILNIYKF